MYFKYQTRILLTQLKLPRCYATGQKPPPKERRPVGLAHPPDPKTVSCDYIGPPDPHSNLRPYVRHYDDNETALAKKLRLMRIEVEAWNASFWSRHNKRFYEEKEDFIRLHKEAGNDDISADRMSVFYKTFLDKNRRIHLMYNLSWYMKNFDMLTLAFMVHVQNLLARAKRRTGD
ncbi:COA8 family protein CG14806, mitochondrial isoform X1 [Drosophila subobscura]|uniref:COA8 family protein CG14806, mitochondrial isoform X1 n=1 Tax=Drosophila subobscura TaxID=7241 RepID=UPI00155AE96E|nr:COA8 family protein CG14806, mitochondrial isoform X1 [Drosophila subobscura]